MLGIRHCCSGDRDIRSGGRRLGTVTTSPFRAMSIEHSNDCNSLLNAAAQGLAADNRQLGFLNWVAFWRRNSMAWR